MSRCSRTDPVLGEISCNLCQLKYGAFIVCLKNSIWPFVVAPLILGVVDVRLLIKLVLKICFNIFPYILLFVLELM